MPEAVAPPSANIADTGWLARLQLGFARRDSGSFLSDRRHLGPLRVQKPLYPEGPGICHAVIVHPPGGIAGGDTLSIDVDVGAGSHAVLSTPAATKWYKSNRRQAQQRVRIDVGADARLDWLPQNNILFDAAQADLDFELVLAPTASAIGWETTQLGRQAAGERWLDGRVRMTTTLRRADGRLLWTERVALGADDPLRDAPQGLGGWPVFGSLWAVGPDVLADTALLERLQALLPFDTDAAAGARDGASVSQRGESAGGYAGQCAAECGTEHGGEPSGIRSGVTCLPGNVLLVRAVAQRIEPLQALLVQCWRLLRPAIHGVPGQPLRLWAT